jgi:hypothetical protein
VMRRWRSMPRPCREATRAFAISFSTSRVALASGGSDDTLKAIAARIRQIGVPRIL